MTLQRGHDLPSDERSHDGFPVVGSGGIVGFHNQPIQQRTGVITGRYGSIGAVHWIEGPHWPLNTTLYVRDAKRNDLRYLYWLLRGLPLGDDASKSAVPGLHRADVHRMTVRAIGRAEVAEIIEQLDAQEANTQILVDRLATLRETLTIYRDALIAEAVTGQLDVSAVSDRQMDERMREAIEAPPA